MEHYKKKIAIFHPWIKSRGGGERVILEFLKNSDYETDVYTWIYEKDRTFEDFENFKIHVIAPKIAELFSRKYLLRGLFLPVALFSKIPLKKYDLFLISSAGLGELITLKNYKPKKTLCYSYTVLRAAHQHEFRWNLRYRYDSLLRKIPYIFAVKIYNIFERLSWKKIDMAFFDSSLVLKRAESKNLIKNKKNWVVYPPVDILKFKKLKTKEEKYFLYAARFNFNKRQDLLIKAWTKFVKKNPSFRLVLAGNIENRKYFEKLLKLAKQTKNIEIKTNVKEPDLLKLMANCLAFVFVPYAEDFGITPFEVLAAGKHLICVNQGGYMELIKDNKNVFKIQEKFYKKEMVEEINNSLEYFLKHKNKAKKIIFKELSIENFRKNISEIFKYAINNRN